MSVVAKFSDVGVRRGGKWLVRHCSFELRKGEVCVIAGPNGAGKSSLLRVGSGVWSPSEGEATIFGRSVWVPDNVEGLEWMTVSEWAYSWTQSLGLEHIMDKLGLGMAMGKPLGKCSRGMRQKALIAPFLAEPPDVLILDEPISTMDPSAGAKTLQLIRECGCAALVSCHLGRLPRGVADTLHVIVDGTISYSCPAKDGVDVEKIYLERGI